MALIVPLTTRVYQMIISSHLELVGGVKRQLYHFPEAMTVFHDVAYGELGEFQEGCLWCISDYGPLCQMIKVKG